MKLTIEYAVHSLSQEMNTSLRIIKKDREFIDNLNQQFDFTRAMVGTSSALYGFMGLITNHQSEVQSAAYCGRYDGRTGVYDSFSGVTQGLLSLDLDMHYFNPPQKGSANPQLVRFDCNDVAFLGTLKGGPLGTPLGSNSSSGRAFRKVRPFVKKYEHKIPLHQ